MIYLDAAATTPVRREALEAMWPYLTGTFGNPSSVHDEGRRAARGLADARATLAGILHCRPGDIVFTSGGTEADNLAIKGLALGAPRGRHIVTSRIEHEAVLESVAYLERVHDFTVDFIETDATGLVTADALRGVLREDTTLVSVAFANNEVGTVQPIAELVSVAHEVGALFHTDAVQAAGWLPLDVTAPDVDALSLSGHKVGAPKGSGALFVRGRLPIEPVLHGGGQERGRRSGTENVAGAVALATAARLSEAERDAHATRAVAARDAFIAAVLDRIPEARLTGHPSRRLPGHASFVIPGVGGEPVLIELERTGIIASSGAACAAGRTDPSHVLLALGHSPEVAASGVRFTWSHLDPECAPALARSLADAVRTLTRDA